MKPAYPVRVKLVRQDNPELPFIKPYINRVGTIISIEMASYQPYQLYIRFDESIDEEAFGKVLPYGFMAYSNDVQVLDGHNLRDLWERTRFPEKRDR